MPDQLMPSHEPVMETTLKKAGEEFSMIKALESQGYSKEEMQQEFGRGLNDEQLEKVLRDTFQDPEQLSILQAEIAGTPRPVSTTTGKSMKTSSERMDIHQKGAEKAMSALTRHGVPMASAPFTGPGVLALITGLSDLTASEMEDHFSGQEYSDYSDYLKNKAANVTEATVTGATSYIFDKAISKAVGYVGRKFNELITKPFRGVPNELRQDVATAQGTLKHFKGPKGELISLPADKLNMGTGNLIETFWGPTARSSILGGGKFRELEKMGSEAIDNFMQSYIKNVKTALPPEDFATLLLKDLNGEKIFMQNLRGQLFDKVRAETAGKVADFSQLRSLIMRSGADFGKVWKTVQSEMTNKTTGKALIPDIKDVAGWKNMPVDRAVEVYQKINKIIGKTSMPEAQHAAGRIKDFLKPKIGNELSKLDDVTLENGKTAALNAIFDEANAFHGVYKDRFFNDAFTKKLLDEFKTMPEVIPAMFKIEGGTGMPGFASGLLKKLKTLYMGQRTPGISLPKVSTLNKEMYQKNVIMPMRHSILMSAVDKETGQISSKLMTNMVNNLERRGDFFFKEVFGGSIKPKNLRDLATTLRILETAPSQNPVFIKLLQGGQLMSLGGAVTGASLGMKELAGGSAVIFLTPKILADVMTNAKKLRALTDGMRSKVGTPAYARMVSNLAATITADQSFDYLKAGYTPEQIQFQGSFDVPELFSGHNTNLRVTNKIMQESEDFYGEGAP